MSKEEKKEFVTEEDEVTEFENVFTQALEGDELEEQEEEAKEGDEEGDEEGQEEEPEEDEPEENEPEDEPNENVEGAPEDEPEEEDEEDAEKILQKYKSLQGMWKSEKQKREELEQRLAALEAGSKKEEPQAKDEKDGDTGKEDTKKPDQEEQFRELTKKEEEWVEQMLTQEEALKEIKEEFPEVYEALTKSFKKTLSAYSVRQAQQVAAILQQSLAPVIETTMQSEAEKHYQAIKEKHEDFEKYIENGELKKWIDSQSPTKKKLYSTIYEEGTADEVIELFNDFKSAKGYNRKESKKKTTQDPRKKKRLEDMEEPKSRTRNVSTGAGRAAKDDFEAAFEEAVRQKK